MFRFLKPKPPPPPAFRHPLSSIDRFLSLTLALAAQEQATAIIIGMPRELPPSIGQENHAEFLRDLTKSHPRHPIPSDLKSSQGWRTVPLWLRIREELYPTHALTIAAHLTFLAIIQDRLVSIDDSERHPSSNRFIEYDSENPLERRFAQVDLWFDEDNTIRIEIARYLTCPSTVHVITEPELVCRR